MKYGLIMFNKTNNIGDDIQSYAATKYLPHIDYYIDRENMDCFVPNEKEFVATIMNGWFLHNLASWPPSPYIYPLLISMFFVDSKYRKNIEYLKGFGSNWFKQYGPVGCRDLTTEDFLKTINVDCYTSGCLTLTIDKFEGIEKQDYICVVDVSDDLVDKLSLYTKREIKNITHSVYNHENIKLTPKQRLENVESILKVYQAAHCVITSRLHVALPCLALGVPVMYLDNSANFSEYDNGRLDFFTKYLHVFSFEDILAGKENIIKYLESPLENKQEYLELRQSLEKKCKDFISKMEISNLDISTLPDIDMYNNFVVKRVEHLKEITNPFINNYKN